MTSQQRLKKDKMKQTIIKVKKVLFCNNCKTYNLDLCDLCLKQLKKNEKVYCNFYAHHCENCYIKTLKGGKDKDG